MTALGIILQSHGQALEESGRSISMGNYLTVVPASPLAKPYLVCFSVRDSGGGRAYTDVTLASFVVIAYRHGYVFLSPTISYLDCSCQTLFPGWSTWLCKQCLWGSWLDQEAILELRVFIKLSSEEAIIEVIDGPCLFAFCYLGAFCFVLGLCI